MHHRSHGLSPPDSLKAEGKPNPNGFARALLAAREEHSTSTVDLFRRSVYSRIAGYDDVNYAEPLSHDPTFRLIGSEKIWERGAVLTSRLQSFETEVLTQEENFARLPAVNRKLIGKAESIESPRCIVLDMDSTKIPVYGQQENGGYHPLLLINREGDCLAAELRPGTVHSADDWEELLLPAESHLTRRLFRGMVRQLEALPAPNG